MNGKILGTLACAVFLSLAAAADCYTLNAEWQTVTLDASTQINSTDRLLVYQGTLVLGPGASIICGGNDNGSCNFIGIDRGAPGGLVLDGGRLWCDSGKGAGVLGVGNNNNGQTSELVLNSGELRVDTRLRCSTMWSGTEGATSSGTVTVNGGTATVKEFFLGATSSSSGKATLNLNGGVVTTERLTFPAFNDQALNLSGGRLVAAADDLFNMTPYADSRSRKLTVTDGKTTIFDTAGFAQRLPAELMGTGTLLVTGGGTVSFESSAPTYEVRLGGVTLAVDATAAELLTLKLSLARVGDYPLVNRVSVNLPGNAPSRVPLFRVASAFGGAELMAHLTCDQGTLSCSGDTVYLDLDGADASSLVYSGAGGDVTPANETYTYLAFLDPTGSYTVGGEGLTLTDGRSILASRSTVPQTVVAPVRATETGRVIVDVVEAPLNLAGGLTANQIVKAGTGTLVLGPDSAVNSVIADGGTIDFGGATHEGRTLNVSHPEDTRRSYDGGGKVVTFTNGTWIEPADNSFGCLDYSGWEVHFGAGFNFAYPDKFGRIALGYGKVAGATSQALVLDEGCGEVILRGNASNWCNFIGVDQDGDSHLIVNAGTLHVLRDDNGEGVIRVAAGVNENVTGQVKVTGGQFIVDWDMTLATVYNGTGGGNGRASFELEGGQAQIAQLYLGATSASAGEGTVRLTGGDLSVKSFVSLGYNKQDLFIDGVAIHALCDDGDRSVKFLEKKQDGDTAARSYVIGANGVDIDTAGFTVHASIPFTGDGQMRVAGGGNLILGSSLQLAEGLTVTDTTLTVPCYATYPTLVLNGDSKLLVDLSNFDGQDEVLTITSGLVLPEGKTADDFAAFVSVVNGEGELSLSEDMKTIRVMAENTIAFRHLKMEGRGDFGDWLHILFPQTAETLPKNELGFLGNSSESGDTTWGGQYFAGSHNRVDGWLKVSDEQAGTWTITAGFDDYIAVGLDGGWQVLSANWNAAGQGQVEVTPGWHSFSIVCGDGNGGYGPTVGAAFPNNFAVGVAMGEGEMVRFDAPNLVFGDPASDIAGDFVLDRAGEVQFYSLKFNPACRLVLDPVKTLVRLAAAPKFSAPGQLALDSVYASATRGRFLLMSWDEGTPVLPAGMSLTNLFDATSAAGAHPSVTVETAGKGGRLWLDLDAEQVQPVTLFMLGAAEGRDAWRAPLARRLSALGYTVKTTGLQTAYPEEVTGFAAPAAWTRQSLLAGVCLRTTPDGVGLDTALEALVDQAGDAADVVLLQIGANDLLQGVAAEELAQAWCEVVARLAALLPTTKIVWGSVTDLGDPAANEQAARYNVLVTEAVQSGRFPANQVFVLDRATAPADEAWLRGVQQALAAPAVAAQKPAVPTTSGSDVNVPESYRAGFKRARVYDAVAAGVTKAYAVNAPVPYEDFAFESGATEFLTRVGYYIELKRKNTDAVDYGGRVRWLWVDMEAFGADPGCVTIDDVGIPFNAGVRQQIVGKLHVVGNVPGIETVAADDDTVQGFVEFWPNSYAPEAGPVAGAPAHLRGYDWNDTPTAGIYGSMQVHRLDGPRNLAAQTLFAYNSFTDHEGEAREIGLGTFGDAPHGTLDWTFSSAYDTLNLSAYEVARIEVWTHGLVDDEDSTDAVTAYWRGTAGGDPADPANWTCYNAVGEVIEGGVPSKYTTIHVNAEGAMNLQAPATSALAFRAFVVDGSIQLTDDTDWRLFGEVALPDGMTIDLNGHKLFVATFAVETADAVMVTDDSVQGGGELHMEIPADTVYTNDKIVFAGRMAFVKEGPGRFDPARKNQLYTGGTVVAGGTMRMVHDGADGALGVAGSNVRVETGATFDVYGYTHYTSIDLTLAGGTLANTAKSGVWQSHGLGNIALTADSFVNKPVDITVWNDGAVLDLGGHTLCVTNGPTQSFLLMCPAKNGTLEMRDTWFSTYENAVDARTVNLRMMDNSMLYLRADLSVRDYYSATAATDTQGDSKLRVYGTFTPVVDTFRGCELQNGAAINLADKPEGWEMASNLSAQNVVTFADGAHIGLDIGSRKVGTLWRYVLTWGDNVPANLETLSFTVTNEEARGAFAEADTTGIRVARFGTILYIR